MCRVAVSSADQLAATSHQQRQQRPSTSNTQQQRAEGDGSRVRGAAQGVEDQKPEVPAVPATPPRVGRPPGSKSRPRVFSEDVSTDPPPARRCAIASEIKTRAVLTRE